MKFERKSFALKAVCCLACAGLSAVAFADQRDPRVRNYVEPTRIVWQSEYFDGYWKSRFKIEKPEALLKPTSGQVPVGGFQKASAGCRLVNGGEAPGIVLDFGRELHGGIQLGAWNGSYGSKVRIRFGESVSETMHDIGEKHATNDHAIRDDVVTLPTFGTREIGNTGFRFVRIDLVTPGSVCLEFVRAVELIRPWTPVGRFRCSDERLNRIFDTAVRTVHLCCQDYLWDGIKRDRLIWMGDTHPETMAILSVFGAQPILPESLDRMAAITPPDEWMYSIELYNLWWIRNLAEWYRFTGNRNYLSKHRDYLKTMVAHIGSHLTPSNTLEGFGRPFLDWPTQANRPAIRSGAQGLALVTFREARFLFGELGDREGEATCAGYAARMETLKGSLDDCGSKQAAAMLALSGLRTPEEMFASRLGRDGVKGFSTFYGYYMLEAMSAAGRNREALGTLRDYWGAMLDVGATSFWEDFNVAWTNNCTRIDELPVAGKRDIHGDFGDYCYPGLRHSLCHGWSSGPAAWLIHHVLGIVPASVGCREVRIEPFLGDLDWAEGALATPHGPVSVRVEKRADGSLKVESTLPESVRAVGK